MHTLVGIKLELEGIHSWSGVVNTHYKDEVGFLQHPHRHIFHIECTKKVNHDDRDIEFIAFKHEIQNYLRSSYWSTFDSLHVFGDMSCEMIAKELLKEFDLESCKVDEDGENYAIVIK